VEESTSTEDRNLGRRRWGIAILLALGVLVNYFDRVNLSVAKDALHNEFGLTTSMFGVLSSAFNWTYGILQLPVGVLLDRFGIATVGRIGAFLWSVASFGSAISPGIGSLFASRLLLGVGEAPSFPGNAKAVGYWFPRQERSLATAFFDAAAKFGPAVGVLLVGALTVKFGWRWSFAATGLISFLFFVAFYIFYRDPKDDPKLSQRELDHMRAGGSQPSDHSARKAGAPLTYLITQPKVLGLVLGFFGYNYCFYLLLTWLPTYFSSLHLDAMHSVLYTSVPWLVATLTDLLIGGWLVDFLVKRGHTETVVRQSVLIGGTVLGLALAGAMYTSNPVIAVVWISIALGGLAAAAPVGWSIPSLIAPRNSVGKVGGILNTGNQTAGVLAPMITGWLVARTNSFGVAFAVAAVILGIGVCSYLFLLGRIEQVPEPAEN
jgi:MFS transporter, ACS family, D-galactonate transporter